MVTMTIVLCATPQIWMLGAGQSSAGADEVAAGLGDVIGRPAPARVSFAEFVRCYHWCATCCSGLHEHAALAWGPVTSLAAPAPELDRLPYRAPGIADL